MSALPDQQQFTKAAANPPEFYRARSDCIDAFANLELSVYRLSGELKVESDEKGQLSQLLKKLRVTPASHSLSHENAAKLKVCCDDAIALLALRADIVHSEMTIARFSSGSCAIFRNAMAISKNLPDARVYDLNALGCLANSARSVGDRLDSLRNCRSQKAKPA